MLLFHINNKDWFQGQVTGNRILAMNMLEGVIGTSTAFV